MTTATQWLAGARPRTLPAAVAPVVVGTGAAAQVDAVVAWKAALALVVALSLQVGVNYANDYSDGIRGTDDERVGPMRLVGSRLATPEAVRGAAFASLAVASVAGGVLLALSGQWWLAGVGALCLAGAWFYTGGRRPYGYAGFGEVAVFVFFGPVAVLGTVLTQSGPPDGLAMVAAVGVGMLACAVLVANNLRDIPTDTLSGKRTLAVLLGDPHTRKLYAALALAPLVISAVTGPVSPAMLLGLLAAGLVVDPVRRVLGGAAGRELIAVLGRTSALLLVWSAATGVGLALDGLVA